MRPLVLVCGLAATSACRADFSYPDFSSTAGLTILGSAAQVGSVLRVAPSNPLATAGAFWRTAKEPVAAGFVTEFSFRVSGSAPVSGRGEGFAFVIQNESVAARGTQGPALGYDGITRSLAVEFDIQATAAMLDPSGNHISVHTRNTLANSASHQFSLGSTSAVPELADGSVLVARIEYTPGTLLVRLNGQLVLSVPVDLAVTGLDQGTAWVGFTGAVSNVLVADHDILGWSLAATPLCYANCDGSTVAPVLNVLDFNCFLSRFAGGESYANCDGSTVPPVLNVLDFNCFLSRFAGGCP